MLVDHGAAGRSVKNSWRLVEGVEQEEPDTSIAIVVPVLADVGCRISVTSADIVENELLDRIGGRHDCQRGGEFLEVQIKWHEHTRIRGAGAALCELMCEVAQGYALAASRLAD